MQQALNDPWCSGKIVLPAVPEAVSASHDFEKYSSRDTVFTQNVKTRGGDEVGRLDERELVARRFDDRRDFGSEDEATGQAAALVFTQSQRSLAAPPTRSYSLLRKGSLRETVALMHGMGSSAAIHAIQNSPSVVALRKFGQFLLTTSLTFDDIHVEDDILDDKLIRYVDEEVRMGSQEVRQATENAKRQPESQPCSTGAEAWGGDDVIDENESSLDVNSRKTVHALMRLQSISVFSKVESLKDGEDAALSESDSDVDGTIVTRLDLGAGLGKKGGRGDLEVFAFTLEMFLVESALLHFERLARHLRLSPLPSMPSLSGSGGPAHFSLGGLPRFKALGTSLDREKNSSCCSRAERVYPLWR